MKKLITYGILILTALIVLMQICHNKELTIIEGFLGMSIGVFLYFWSQMVWYMLEKPETVKEKIAENEKVLSKLSLDRLEGRLDKALSKETKESLNDFLKTKRDQQIFFDAIENPQGRHYEKRIKRTTS